MEEEAAVAKARAGEVEAFQALVERYSRDVFRLAFRITRNEMDAEDAVQETFLRAFKKLRSFDGRSSFGTWLYRVTANTSIDVLRRRRRGEGRTTSLEEEGEHARIPVSGDPSAERLLFSSEIRSRLTNALGGLSDLERTAFVLRHFQNVPMSEISLVLNLRMSATKQAVFRAVRKVRKTLEPMVRTTS